MTREHVTLDDFTAWDAIAAMVVSGLLALTIIAGTVVTFWLTGGQPVILPKLVAVESWIGTAIIVYLGTHRRVWDRLRNNTTGGYNHA